MTDDHKPSAGDSFMCALIVVLFACIAYGFGFADGKRQKEAVERNCGKFTGETGTIKFKWNEKQ